MLSLGISIMDDLATYLLDILQNSIKAQAKTITLEIEIDQMISIIIKDDGVGIPKDKLKLVTSPFYTTRTTRKVGLGLPLFKMLAEQTDGTFEIDSEVNVGTQLKLTLNDKHMDMPQIGNLGEMIYMMTIHQDSFEFIFTIKKKNNSFTYKKTEILDMFHETIMDYEIMTGLKNWINNEIKNIRGEQ
jgi:anti-sigma regulatory factor (Ser/Thr protein kinase)